MAGKFARSGAVAAPQAPIRTTGRPLPTGNMGHGFERDAKSELFMLACASAVGEDTFYESAKARDERLIGLIAQVTREDADWMRRFVPYLRRDLYIRSASIVLACEYVKAGGPFGAAVIDAAIARADEPAEVIAYWHAAYGRRIPKPVKRGVARALRRVLNEQSAIKYDADAAMRMGDVIELVHAKPRAEWQSALYRYLIDRRHNRPSPRGLESLPMVRKALSLSTMDKNELRALLRDPEALAEAGTTWERLSGMIGPMDAAAWEAIIPSMGYFALLRNLRNFDQAGISQTARAMVRERLADPDAVRKAKVLPLRFLSAWKNVAGMEWGPALEAGINNALANVPALPGSTLIMVDCSISMQDTVFGRRSTLSRCEAAGVFGSALALRAEKPYLVAYDTSNKPVRVATGGSVLRLAEQFKPGGSTDTWGCTLRAYSGQDRIIILTDEQANWSRASDASFGDVPIYTFNLAGYKAAHAPSGSAGRYSFGGLSDAAFTLLPILESRRNGDWPF